MKILKHGGCLLMGVFLLAGGLMAQTTTKTGLKGLVFEAEDWTTPRDAWTTNAVVPNKWRLWTTEGHGKRSRDAALVSPKIEKDRATPEEGAPPLHTRITGIPAGTYQAWLGPTTRPLAYSLDGGRTWLKSNSGETELGVYDIRDGTFEMWVDDRFANPASIGPTYYDYIRLEPFVPPTLQRVEAITLPDGSTQISWVTSVPVSAARVECAGHAFTETEEGLRNHRVMLTGLPSGATCEARIFVPHARPETIRFVAGARPRIKRSQAITVAISVTEPTSEPRTQWPLTSGVPFVQGTLAAAEDLRLVGPDGQPVPAQFEPVAWWPDGSIKWVWASFQADTVPHQARLYKLTTSPSTPVKPEHPVAVVENGDGLILRNDFLQLRINKASFALWDGLTLNGKALTGTARDGNGSLTDGKGGTYHIGPADTLVVEEHGPLRAVVRVGGDFVSAGGEHFFRWQARYEMYAGQRWARLSWTLGNNRTNETLTELQSAEVRIPFAAQGAWHGTLADAPAATIADGQNIWLLQDKDNRFTVSINGQQRSGEKASGFVAGADTAHRLAVFVRDFWQLYPKGLAIEPDGLHVQVLPPLPADEYTAESKNEEDLIRLYYGYHDGRYLIKRGLESTTDLFVQADEIGPAPSLTVCNAWFQNPLFAVTAPAHACATGVFGPLAPRQAGVFETYEKQVASGFAKLEKNRQQKHEYGWMNYGDWHGERHFNWGNLEYDLAGALAEQFTRTGDLAYLDRAAQAARHNTDIDTIHYPWQPRMAGRVYAHSVGHVGGFFDPADARFQKLGNVFGLSDARRPNPFVTGAIDPGGHVFQPGNFLAGFLTGERRQLEVAEMVCAAQATYLTPKFDFGIERAAGWPLRNAVSAYEATGNPFFLNAARIYVEKIVGKQTARGDWNLPHGPPECLHKPPHPGGKAFATGVLLNALMLYDRVAPSPEVKACIVRAAHWLERDSWNHETHSFRYIDTCPTYAKGGRNDGTDFLVSSGLAYACTLDSDPALKALLLDSLSRAVKSGVSVGKDYAQDINHTPFALAILLRNFGVKEFSGP